MEIKVTKQEKEELIKEAQEALDYICDLEKKVETAAEKVCLLIYHLGLDPTSPDEGLLYTKPKCAYKDMVRFGSPDWNRGTEKKKTNSLREVK